MSRLLLLFLLVACARISVADSQPVAPRSTEEALAVLTTLSERSGLSRGDIVALLQDCDVSQTSMNFCAWRDQVAAERELDRAIAGTIARRPDCRDAIETGLASWRSARDSGCEKSAAADYAGGSMMPMARAMCVRAETVRMTRRIAHMKECRLR